MANPIAYVCKVQGCPVAKAGRLMDGRGLVGHYRRAHGSAILGQRQLAIQKAKLAKVAVLPITPLSPDHVADELLPGAVEVIHQIRGEVSEVVIAEDAGSFLQGRIDRLKADYQEALKKLDEAEKVVKKLHLELSRTEAAKAAFDKAE